MPASQSCTRAIGDLEAVEPTGSRSSGFGTMATDAATPVEMKYCKLRLDAALCCSYPGDGSLPNRAGARGTGPPRAESDAATRVICVSSQSASYLKDTLTFAR